MSFLTPFYILGALAIAAPVVLHLIRRTPKGEVPFSSLMFLAPTPPRLTRRSRLDNILLLLLRTAALALLALAFARPFLREAASLNFGDVERRRDLVLIDTSASLRRGDLWPKAKALAEAAIVAARPADQLAVYAFDSTTRPLLTFAESLTLDPAKRLAIARARLAQLEPTWASTDLGQGLVDAVGAIEDVGDSSEKLGRMPRRITLVGDLAQGSKLDALGNFEWPSDVELDLKTVGDPAPNAGVHAVNESTEATLAEVAKDLRVRVSNDPGSRREAFQLTWLDAKAVEVGPSVDAYVPGGETRVVKVPREPGRSALRLKGDAPAFDNTLYVATEAKGEEATVLYLGNDSAEDAEGLSYYLARVFEETPRRTVKLVSKQPTEPIVLDSPRSTPLVVLAGETSAENAARLRKYAEAGGTVLDVIAAPGASPTLSTLSGATSPVETQEAPSGRDALLGEIAFDHPLFAPLAGAQFNDFTKIRFWKHRRIDPQTLGDARVLARFEGGDPAFLEKVIGQGRLVVLTSGWNPVDSQLARSSKFVPLMAAMLEGRSPPPVELASLTVGDRLPVSASDRGTIRKPDGSTFDLSGGSASFDPTDQPGLYVVDSPSGSRVFAVNLDPLESKTAPLGVETLERLGCRLTSGPAKQALDLEHLRQLQNSELEGRQKLWRGLILAAIGVLILETWLAGRLLKRPSPPSEALAT